MHARVDQYGFENDEDFDQETYDEVMSTYLPVLAHRSRRWLKTYGEVKHLRKSAKVKRFCRKGIPAEWRAELWFHFSGAAECMQREPDLYRKLLRSDRKDTSVLESIEMDLHRTFPENIYFCDSNDPSCLRQPLRRVLVAIACKNPLVGYCQGLNFVAGLLLVIARDEERVFWIMDCLINRILPGYYNPDMMEIQAEQEFLGELVKWKCPVVSAHLQRHGVSWMLIATKWFICAFADVLPTETCLRLWDCLFYEGIKVIYRAALTLVMINQDKLLQANTFADIVKEFKATLSDRRTVDCHRFTMDLFTIPGSFPRSRIKKLRDTCIKNKSPNKT